MEFSQSEAARSLAAKAREFVESEVIPLEALLESRDAQSLDARLETARSRARSGGLWAPHMPRELGGMGLSLLELAFVSEELGRSPLGHFAANAQAPDAGNMEILLHHGTPEQKRRFLEPLVRGEVRSCFSMTEPDRPGSNPTWLETRAVLDGDHYVIDGHKWFTSSADGATFAIVMAVTDPDAAPHLRASQILVPVETPGFQRVRNIPVMGEAGHGWMSHAEIRYTGCRVPRENLIGAQGAGFALAQDRLGPGRIHHCMRWIGICERAFDLLCGRALTRELAPGERLADQQIVQGWIAESRASIEAARLLVLRAAWKIQEQGARAAREEISQIKYFVAGVLQEVLDRAVQAHGALGVTDATPLAYFYRHERAARIYDGPDEVHKLLVARLALKRFAQTRPAAR